MASRSRRRRGGTLEITRQEYTDLLKFRTRLRRFLRWSEEQARAAGLTPAQHQLLLAVKGHPGAVPPTIGELSQSLLLRHHSTVELIDRAGQAGLVVRRPDPDDGRVVRVRLTTLGEQRLIELAALHLAEIRVNALVRAQLEQDEPDLLAGPFQDFLSPATTLPPNAAGPDEPPEPDPATSQVPPGSPE